MNTTQIVAPIPIGRLQRPSFQGPPGTIEPARSRRNTGVMYAMYRPMTAIDVTAAYATGLNRYGRPRMNAPTAASQIEFVGVRVRGLIRCQKFAAGDRAVARERIDHPRVRRDRRHPAVELRADDQKQDDQADRSGRPRRSRS